MPAGAILGLPCKPIAGLGARRPRKRSAALSARPGARPGARQPGACALVGLDQVLGQNTAQTPVASGPAIV